MAMRITPFSVSKLSPTEPGTVLGITAELDPRVTDQREELKTRTVFLS